MLVIFFLGVLAKYKNKNNTKTCRKPQNFNKITEKSHSIVHCEM